MPDDEKKPRRRVVRRGRRGEPDTPVPPGHVHRSAGQMPPRRPPPRQPGESRKWAPPVKPGSPPPKEVMFETELLSLEPVPFPKTKLFEEQTNLGDPDA